MFSCTESNEHDEDDKIVLTKNNYIFEGDLYKYALNVQIDSLKIRVKELRNIIDNGQTIPGVKNDYETTRENLEATVITEASVLGYDELMIRLGPRGGLPQPPRPTVIPYDLKYIVTYNVLTYNLIGTDEQGKIVLKSDKGNNKILPDTDGLLKAQKVALIDAKFQGAVLLRAKRVNMAEESAQYKVRAAVMK